MRVCVICNFSDTRCGIANFGHQTVTALRHAGHEVLAWDGTYPEVYRRREAGLDPHLPPDLDSYDVLHVIWHAITLNHYAGVDWASFPSLPHGGPILSLWDCGPSDAYCPFDGWFPLRWMLYKDHREGYQIMDYPVPDWVEGLPPPPPPPHFTVGGSSVRGDGMQELQQVCQQHGWIVNLPTPGVWLSIEDEIRRLAKSTVNVCWYHSNAIWKDRASAPSMLIASARPLLVNDDALLAHLKGRRDIYHGTDMTEALEAIYDAWLTGMGLRIPLATYADFRWEKAAARMTQVWREAQQRRTAGRGADA